MQRLLVSCCLLLGIASLAEAADWHWAFLAGDGNRDGQLDRSEIGGLLLAANPLLDDAQQTDRLLKLFDRNGDQRLSQTELRANPDKIKPDPQPAGLRSLRDIPYRGGPSEANGLQMLDCFIPAAAQQAPVLVFIHGGGWAIGDKRRLNDKLTWWCGQGGIMVSVNYRLSPTVQHPAHIDDVAAAVAWVIDHIAEYGGDPKRVFVMGHSAGGHLAALVGADRRRLAAYGHQPQELAGIILLDSAGFTITERIAALPADHRARTMYEAAFGSDPAVHADASPALRVADPGAQPPPFCLTYSAWRPDAATQARIMSEAVHTAGGEAIGKAFAKSHRDMNIDVGSPRDPLTAYIQAFIDRQTD